MTDKIKLYLEDRLKRLEDIKNKREWTTAELGDATCCKQTLAFINSLQEEPVSEDEIEKSFSAGDVVVYVSRHPAYSGLYLLGNPNDLSIGYSNANEPYQIYLRNCTIASEDERKQFMRELNLNGYKWNENTLRIEKIEKPVSDDLEETAKHYLYSNILYDDVYVGNPTDKDCIEMFKLGAKWQKEQDQSTIELAEDHAMLAGMEKMKEEMMKDATEAVVAIDSGGYPYIDKTIELYDYDKDIPLAKEGDKYKVILIKEN